MKNQSDQNDDQFMDHLKEIVEDAGFEIAPPEVIDELIAHGAQLEAERDEDARIEGRRFLNEETDQEIIEMWWKDAAACRSIDEAAAFAHRLLSDYRHDYGTICHALSAGILAMAWGMNREPEGGITGFQSGFVMWGFVKRWMRLDGPLRLVQYTDLLFPQSDDKFTTIDTHTAESLTETARKKLAETPADRMSPVVRQRWEEIAAGTFPAFVTVETA